MPRERDVRNAIRDALMATGYFSDAWVTGLPENYGQAASDLTAAAIEPHRGHYLAEWDAPREGGLEIGSVVDVTLLVRNQDAQLRDEQAEQLLDVLANAVNGQSLGGLTMPGKTMVVAWAWQRPRPPERRIKAQVRFSYLTDAWNSFDTTQ